MRSIAFIGALLFVMAPGCSDTSTVEPKGSAVVVPKDGPITSVPDPAKAAKPAAK